MNREPVHTEGRRFAGWAVMIVLGVLAMAVVVLLVVQPWPSPGPEELDSTVPEMPGPNTPDVGTPVPLNYHWLSPEGSHGREAGPRAATTPASVRSEASTALQRAGRRQSRSSRTAVARSCARPDSSPYTAPVSRSAATSCSVTPSSAKTEALSSPMSGARR